MPAWTAKDPDWTADWRYEPTLDAGDAVATITLARLSGDVDVSAPQPDDTGITVTLSGGTDGTTAVYRVEWTTTGGRTFDDIIVQPVASTSAEVAQFFVRYPELAAQSPAAVSYWLVEARKIVAADWDDETGAAFAFAAHKLARAGAGSTGIPAGVTRFRSGSMDVAFTEAAANALNSGGYDSTPYGQEFAVYLRRNRGGARLVC